MANNKEESFSDYMKVRLQYWGIQLGIGIFFVLLAYSIWNLLTEGGSLYIILIVVSIISLIGLRVFKSYFVSKRKRQLKKM